MEDLEIEVLVNMSVELQIITFLVVAKSGLKLLEAVPYFDTIVQPITVPPLLVHWYEATSLEHTGPGPTNFVD